MNEMKKRYPPLTPEDIQSLRGKPVVKLTLPVRNVHLPHNQEWIYISIPNNAEEHYYFKNGYLKGWKKMAL